MNLIRTELGISIARGAEAGGGLLPVRQILGIGRNYAEHAKEQGAEVPDKPMVFTKSLSSLALSGDAIVIPKICRDKEQVDYEGELAVVIGKSCKDVSEAQAADPASGIVLGYCVANDVSARCWQKQGSGGQFYRGKSFDTFCPIGPRVVAAARVGDPSKLRLKTTLNGEVVQDASTGEMIFPVFNLIADLSRDATLPAGTIILTGTPSGVGMSRNPQRFLKVGDTVVVEIDKIGSISNSVVAAP